MGKRKTPINWKVSNDRQVEKGRKLAKFTRQMSESAKTYWDSELSEMNKGKIGPKYQYPDTFVLFLLIIRDAFGLSFRILEGYSSEFFGKVPDYSRIQRRINKLPLELIQKINKEVIISKTKGKLDIIADATGMQINGRHVWREEKYGSKTRRNWKKLHLVIDVRTGIILSCEVLEGSENEGKHENVVNAIGEAIKTSGKTVARFYGDGSYGSANNLAFFDYLGIEPIVRIRKDSVKKAHRKFCKGAKLSLRERKAIEQYNWDKFVEEKSYGQRSKIEGIIGAVKCFFGEKIMSKLDPMIEIESQVKTLLWNVMQ